jgi:ParB/Sulfiredoxin domain
MDHLTTRKQAEMAKKQHAVINARTVGIAMADAERALERPNGASRIMNIKPTAVRTRAELFQPRKFSEGFHEVDAKHVKDLKIRIGKKGELDPIIVVKTGGQWVCVDGHHRLAAYGSLKWKETIKCQWFAGSIAEAMDESLLKNEVAKLPINQGDRFEEAWRRTVMGRGSKSQVVAITGVSDGTVALMRRIFRSYQAQDAAGRKLREQRGDIMVERWEFTRMAWLGIEGGEFDAVVDAQARAARLARRMNSRLTNSLSKDAETTARALYIYDPSLCEPLANALMVILKGEAYREAKENLDALGDDEPRKDARATGA